MASSWRLNPWDLGWSQFPMYVEPGYIRSFLFARVHGPIKYYASNIPSTALPGFVWAVEDLGLGQSVITTLHVGFPIPGSFPYGLNVFPDVHI